MGSVFLESSSVSSDLNMFILLNKFDPNADEKKNYISKYEFY